MLVGARRRRPPGLSAPRRQQRRRLIIRVYYHQTTRKKAAAAWLLLLQQAAAARQPKRRGVVLSYDDNEPRIDAKGAGQQFKEGGRILAAKNLDQFSSNSPRLARSLPPRSAALVVSFACTPCAFHPECTVHHQQT